MSLYAVPNHRRTRPVRFNPPPHTNLSGLGAMPSISVAPWVKYGAMAGFLALAAMRRISWLIAIAGAGASYFLLNAVGATAGTAISGTAIDPTGATFPLSNVPVDSSGVLVANNKQYTVITSKVNPDGTTTYFLDFAGA